MNDNDLTHDSQHGEEPQGPSRETLLKQVGQRLQNTRLHRDIGMEDTVHALKLRRVYVEALESGNWNDLPGEVYAIGFLRQYATYLDLNLDEDIQQLKSEDYELTRPETFPDPPIAPKKGWVIVALLVLLVLFIAYNIFSTREESPAPAPSKVEAPATPGNTVITTEPESPDAPATETSQPPREEPAPVTEPAETEPAATTQPDVPVVHTYLFQAVGEDVWLQLHTNDDPPKLLREALLHAGDTLTVTHPDTVLSLTCGNPAALAVDVDGKRVIAAGRLGEPGKVIRDYRLHVPDN